MTAPERFERLAWGAIGLDPHGLPVRLSAHELSASSTQNCTPVSHRRCTDQSAELREGSEMKNPACACRRAFWPAA